MQPKSEEDLLREISDTAARCAHARFLTGNSSRGQSLVGGLGRQFIKTSNFLFHVTSHLIPKLSGTCLLPLSHHLWQNLVTSDNVHRPQPDFQHESHRRRSLHQHTEGHELCFCRPPDTNVMIPYPTYTASIWWTPAAG